jgi:hypothetical protein
VSVFVYTKWVLQKLVLHGWVLIRGRGLMRVGLCVAGVVLGWRVIVKHKSGESGRESGGRKAMFT